MPSKVVRLKPDRWLDEFDEIVERLRADTTIGVSVIIHEAGNCYRAVVIKDDAPLSLETIIGRMRVLEHELMRENGL